MESERGEDFGDGGTDCHGQCAHWPRNDIGFSWGCGVRRGTWAPPYKGLCNIAGGQRRPPLRKRNKRCNGRATARVAPTKALQGVRRGERNSPGTASPCQPPLGKGAMGTGVRIATGALRPRNDTFYKGCGVRRGTWAPPYKGLCNIAGGQRRPPLRKRNKRCNGRATARVAPTEALQEVRWGGPM